MSKENYYVDPVEFKESLWKYYETDILTDDLAENIKKIAYGLSYNKSFREYTYREDMIGDALIKMYSALKRKKYSFKAKSKFHEDKQSNPFSYFTQIAFNAFINRIKHEKRTHEAEKQYRERVYEEIMSDPELCNAVIYVKPIDHENDEFED
jgi:DNA-directed RNA polymerase specialized sigma24 family protein